MLILDISSLEQVTFNSPSLSLSIKLKSNLTCEPVLQIVILSIRLQYLATPPAEVVTVNKIPSNPNWRKPMVASSKFS